MVHALIKIHGLLEAHGRLIDIHPSGEPPPLSVWLDDQPQPAGWLWEVDENVKYEQAAAALAEVVARGWYEVTGRMRFAYITRSDSLGELQEYLATRWSGALLQDSVARRIADWLQIVARRREIVLEELVDIACYRPLPQPPTMAGFSWPVAGG